MEMRPFSLDSTSTCPPDPHIVLTTSANQVEKLRQEYHIYLTKNGRISMAGNSSSRNCVTVIIQNGSVSTDSSSVPGSRQYEFVMS